MRFKGAIHQSIVMANQELSCGRGHSTCSFLKEQHPAKGFQELVPDRRQVLLGEDGFFWAPFLLLKRVCTKTNPQKDVRWESGICKGVHLFSRVQLLSS